MEAFEFYVDLSPYRSAPPEITCSQYDIGRPFRARLRYKGAEYQLPDGCSISIHERKPSGKIVTSPAVGLADTVYFEIEEQMSPEAGKCQMEIAITGDGNRPIGSANFILKVEPSVLENGIESESTIGEVQRALNAAGQAEASANQAASSATAAASSASAAASSAQAAADNAEKAGEAAEEVISAGVEDKLKQISQYAADAQAAKTGADTSAEAAKRSATAAGESETNAKASEQKAKEYADQTAGNVNTGNVTMYYDTDGDLCLSAVITV